MIFRRAIQGSNFDPTSDDPDTGGAIDLDPNQRAMPGDSIRIRSCRMNSDSGAGIDFIVLVVDPDYDPLEGFKVHRVSDGNELAEAPPFYVPVASSSDMTKAVPFSIALWSDKLSTGENIWVVIDAVIVPSSG